MMKSRNATWPWALGILLFVACLYVAYKSRVPSVAEGFKGSEPLTTGVEVALWFSSHVFLRAVANEPPQISRRYLYPEEIPIGKGDFLWVLESARDPPRTPARFQLFHREEPIRLRNARTGQYLVWEVETYPKYEKGDPLPFAPGTLKMKPFDQLKDQEGHWIWSTRGMKKPGSGLQWGDRVVFRPQKSAGALVLNKGVPTVLPEPMTGSDEILLVDRWGRGQEKEQGRFGRARSSSGKAYLAIDGREDTYCRVLPANDGVDAGKTWWELDLPMGKTWVDRIAITMPEMDPPMASEIRVSLWMNKSEITKQVWTSAQLPSAPQTQTPTRLLQWQGVQAHVQKVRIDASGPLYLAQVKVYGEASPMADHTDGIAPLYTTSVLPRNALEMGGPASTAPNTKPVVIERKASELPRLRHYLTSSFWLRLEASGAPRTLLWEWERKKDKLSGWRVFVDPIKGQLDWNLFNAKGKLLTKLEVQVQDLVGRDVHVGLFLRAPVSKGTGWHLVPGVCVVHPLMRIKYRLDAISPTIQDLPWYPNTTSLRTMKDLGVLQDGHLRMGLEVWIDGKKASEASESASVKFRDVVPNGALRLTSTAPAGFYGVLRSMRMSNEEPTEEMWSSTLRDGGQLVREITRFPVRAAELPVAGAEWAFGAWIYPHRRRGAGPQRLFSLTDGSRASWSWMRMDDLEDTAEFQWMNTTFRVPLEEWSWVVLSYAPMKPRIFVQGRLRETNMVLQTAATSGDLLSEAETAEVVIGRCKYGNIAIEREEDSWTLRATHPEAPAFRIIQDTWNAVGCPGRWDLERDPVRTRRWLRLLQREGQAELSRVMTELFERAQRYLRQESPRGEEVADRAAVEVCYYPIPMDAWDKHRVAAQKAAEERVRTAPVCLPMVNNPGSNA